MVQQTKDTDSDSTTDDEDVTTSTKVRYKYLASLMAFIIITNWMGLFTFVVVFDATFRSVGPESFFVTVLLVLSAGGWVFGVDLVQKYLNK